MRNTTKISAGDVISIADLLYVAGLDLDEVVEHHSKGNSSARVDGVTLRVRVAYWGSDISLYNSTCALPP